MIKLKMKVTQEKQQKMTLKVETLGIGNSYDYNKLINKPTLNGETIQNDMKKKTLLFLNGLKKLKYYQPQN